MYKSRKKIQYILNHQRESIQRAVEVDFSFNDRDASSFMEEVSNSIHFKGLQWFINCYINGEFFFEDIDQVSNDLNLFFAKKHVHKKDINTLSKSEFYRIVESLDTTVKTKQQIKFEGSEKVLNNDDLVIIKLLTGEAAKFYAANTKWCTSNPATFENYSKNGPVYVIVAKGANKKFQIHVPSSQFKDEIDSDVSEEDIEMLSNCEGWKEFLEYLNRENYPQLFEEIYKENKK
jgi:hypothetical protein